MEGFNGNYNFGNVKSDFFLRKSHLLLNKFEKFSAGQIFKHQVEVGFILQSLIAIAKEIFWIEASNDLLFIYYVLDLFLSFNLVFVQLFQGIVLKCVQVFR